MMDREGAGDLVSRLSGDEHDWVDLKEDYYVLGLDNKKADFIKDVSSMTNTISDRDSHYIIIGVNDETGELVGVDDDFDDESDPRHILGVDEADLQQALTEYISPTPNVTLNKFTDEDPKFGILSINQLKKKPSVIQKSIYFHGDQKLQKGLIYFRSGSSNTIARRSDIEQIIDERVKNRREDILDGIRKATEIGPEAVATVGDLVHEEGEGDIVVEVGEEGDFILEERFSREPITNLDERLTLDMKRWATTDTITMDSTTLWEYYCSPDKLSIDEQSVLFLTKSSLELDTYGAFWLTYVDIDSIRDILFSASNGHHQNKDISKIFAALGDRKGIEELYEIISSSTDIGDFPDYLDACDKRATSRLNTILSKTTHKIGYSEWAETIELNSLDTDDLQELIQTLAFHLQELEDRSSGYDRWHQKRNEFRDCLKDTELTLLLRKS